MFGFKSRRKRTFINTRVQGRFLARVAAYWITYHAVLWHGLFVYRYAQVRMSSDGAPFAPLRSVYWQFCIDYSPLLICSLLIMPLFMLDFVRLTHRIIGPLVRASDSLQGLMEGRRIPHVEFRKGDLLTEFQSRLNDFLAFYDDQRAPRSSHAPSGSSQAPVQPMSHEQAEVIASVMTAPAPATAGSPA